MATYAVAARVSSWTMKKQTRISLTDKAMRALTNAVAKVVEDHRRQARPLAVWRDGRVVWIPASDAGTLHESPRPYRTRQGTKS